MSMLAAVSEALLVQASSSSSQLPPGSSPCQDKQLGLRRQSGGVDAEEATTTESPSDIISRCANVSV
jgi:hypothetical protein